MCHFSQNTRVQFSKNHLTFLEYRLRGLVLGVTCLKCHYQLRFDGRWLPSDTHPFEKPPSPPIEFSTLPGRKTLGSKEKENCDDDAVVKALLNFKNIKFRDAIKEISYIHLVLPKIFQIPLISSLKKVKQGNNY